MKGINEKKMNLTTCHNSRSKCPISWKEQFLRQKGLCLFILRNGALRLLFLYHGFQMALSKGSKAMALFPFPFLPPSLNFHLYFFLLVLLCPSPEKKLYLYLDKPRKEPVLSECLQWGQHCGRPYELPMASGAVCHTPSYWGQHRDYHAVLKAMSQKWVSVGWKKGVSKAAFFLGTIRVLPSFPQFLELSCISWLVAPSYTFKASKDRLSFTHQNAETWLSW